MSRCRAAFNPTTSGLRRYGARASGEAAWDRFSKGYGPTRSLAASLDPERRASFREDFIAFHAGFATELGVCVPREYWLTVGVRV